MKVLTGRDVAVGWKLQPAAGTIVNERKRKNWCGVIKSETTTETSLEFLSSGCIVGSITELENLCRIHISTYYHIFKFGPSKELRLTAAELRKRTRKQGPVRECEAARWEDMFITLDACSYCPRPGELPHHIIGAFWVAWAYDRCSSPEDVFIEY
jgi:hypothetical protein